MECCAAAAAVRGAAAACLLGPWQDAPNAVWRGKMLKGSSGCARSREGARRRRGVARQVRGGLVI